MKYKKRAGERVFDIFNYSFMVLLIVVTVYPFMHLFFTSLSDVAVLKQTGNTFMFWPKGFSLEAYRNSLSNSRITRAFMMSVFYVAAATLYNVTLTLTGGYVLSRRNLLWKNVIMVIIIIPMFFGGGLIPSYLVNTNVLHLKNSVWVMIVGAISSYSMVMVRTNIQQVPLEMEESAFIDGAGHFQVLFRVLSPLVKPIIAVISLWSAVGTWNDWFRPLIYFTDSKLFPLQVILREILVESSDKAMNMTGIAGPNRIHYAETIKGAVAMIATIPILCVYPFLQKYFTKGIMIGALKG